jgi:hypothetical protein
MPQRFDKLSGPERRELHLALALRIAQLDGIDTRKMGPSGKAKIREQLTTCKDLDKAIQKARGK